MPEGRSGVVVAPVVRLLMLVISGITTGAAEIAPSGPTVNLSRSEVCGTQSVVPSADHSGPSAATVPSPMVLSLPLPVPTCWTTLPLFRSMTVRKPVKSFQVRAARNWPFGLIAEDSTRPSLTRSRVPAGLTHWLVGSRTPLA
jgi:hypothetical protein